MLDRFNQTLNFAADPPEGGGGTKAAVGGAPVQSDSATEDPTPADPPDGSGGTGTSSTTPSNSTTTAE